MTAESSLAILPDPPAELKTLSARLSERIRSLIAQSGPIPFSTFMDMALYEPGLGYYSNGMRKFGSEGDFVTAPELGDVFSRCVANMIAEGTDDIPDAEIIELGAGSGVMAHDIIQALASQGRQVRYRILERSGDLRDRQIQHLAQVSNLPNVDLEWLDQPPTEPRSGINLANQVNDA